MIGICACAHTTGAFKRIHIPVHLPTTTFRCGSLCPWQYFSNSIFSIKFYFNKILKIFSMDCFFPNFINFVLHLTKIFTTSTKTLFTHYILKSRENIIHQIDVNNQQITQDKW